MQSHNFSGSGHGSSFNAMRGSSFGNSGSFHSGSSAFRGPNHVNFNSAVNPGHFTAGTHNHPVDPQGWHHDSNWWHSGGNWDHHGFDDFHHRVFFSPFIGVGFGDPFGWSFGPYYGGYGYGRYYPYCEYYYGSNYDSAPAAYVTTPIVTDETANYDQVLPPSETPVVAAGGEETDWGNQYLNSARDAFQQGSYSDALRLANHAAVEMPKSAKTHELISLAFFALKDYRGANLEAHAALSLGQASDWPALYAYYGDLPAYTKQIDALVDYLHEHKDAADARFVLAYHNLMMGHSDAAKSQFEKVLAKVPQDKLAGELLKKLGGTPPAVTPPAPEAPAAAVPPTPGEDKPKADDAKSF
jgi:hypothetical protein